VAHALSHRCASLELTACGAHLNIFLRTLFFLSALAPAILLTAATQVYKHGGTAEAFGWIGAGALACALPFLIIKAAAKQVQRMPIKIKKVESQDWYLMVFVVSYFVPLVANVADLHTLAALIVIAAILLATLETIPCHPVLHVFRYRFYKLEGDNGMIYILIARRPILTAKDITSVRQLSSKLLLEGR
jgi:hypothetical protein